MILGACGSHATAPTIPHAVSTSAIEGVVTDEQSHGLSGVTVAVQPPRASGPPATTTSDDRGHYWIDAEPGDYDVTFYLRDVVVQAKVHVSRDHVTRLDRAIRINYPDATEATPPPATRSRPPASLEGVVVDQQTQEKLMGVTVTVAGSGLTEVVLSDECGRYSFDKLPTGDYKVGFFYADVQEQTAVHVASDETTHLDRSLAITKPGQPAIKVQSTDGKSPCR